MKTKEDVYKRLILLYELGVQFVLKHSLYLPNVSFEFTRFPTSNIYPPADRIEVVLYADDTFDNMCNRIDQFLKERQNFLATYATEDFKSLLDKNGLAEYFGKKQSQL
jgi:hypothetical protein